MKVICIDSIDPESVTETLIGSGYAEEADACAHRDELRKTFETKGGLWFEVVSDDYVLKAAPPSSPPPAPAVPTTGNGPTTDPVVS